MGIVINAVISNIVINFNGELLNVFGCKYDWNQMKCNCFTHSVAIYVFALSEWATPCHAHFQLKLT